MRSILKATVGLAFLAAACGESSRGKTNAGAGTSAGVVPTTGGAQISGGTTSGGGTSGSMTAGGGSSSGGAPSDLPAGAPCTFDSACASGNCGVDGSGHCCLSPERCPLGDGGKACGPVGCDDTGACVYADASTSCGTSSCFNTLYIPFGSCDGTGRCTPGEPLVCPAHHSCNDAGTCNTTCSSSADCARAFFCNASQCILPRTAGSCTEEDDCPSGVCSGLDAGADGGIIPGLCCAQSCLEPSPVCRSTTCEEATGDCLYPVGLICAAPGCQEDKAFVPTCDVHGACLPIVADCPDDLSCNSTNTACNASCTQNADCVSGTTCDVDAGTCSPT